MSIIHKNQKGFSLVESIVALSLVGGIALIGTQGTDKIHVYNESLKANAHAFSLTKEAEVALSDFSQCKAIFSTYFPTVTNAIIMSSKNTPYKLVDFQKALSANAKEFKTPEIKQINKWYSISAAQLQGSSHSATAGLNVLFQDDSLDKLVPVKSAGKIYAGVVRMQYTTSKGSKASKVIGKNFSIPIYFFTDYDGSLKKCTSSPEKMQVLQGSCNALGGILAYDGCRAAVFETCDPALSASAYKTCLNTFARKTNIPKRFYAPIIGSSESIFCLMEKHLQKENPSYMPTSCP